MLKFDYKSQEIFELTLNVLKLLATGLGIVSGLIGILTSTKDKESGKITSWGKKLALIILLSGVVALGSQAVEIYVKRVAEQRDHKERAEDEENTLAILDKATALQLELSKQDTKSDALQNNLISQSQVLDKAANQVANTARTSTKALSDIQRLGDPLKDFRHVKFTLDFVEGQAIARSYRNRLSVNYGESEDNVSFAPGDMAFPQSENPDERTLYLMASFENFQMVLSGSKEQLHAERYTSWRGSCITDGSRGRVRIFMWPREPGDLSTFCDSFDVQQIYRNREGFDSSLDFPGSAIFITISLRSAASDLPKLEEIAKVPMTLDVRLEQSSGQVIEIEGIPRVPCNTYVLCFARKLKTPGAGQIY